MASYSSVDAFGSDKLCGGGVLNNDDTDEIVDNISNNNNNHLNSEWGDVAFDTNDDSGDSTTMSSMYTIAPNVVATTTTTTAAEMASVVSTMLETTTTTATTTPTTNDHCRVSQTINTLNQNKNNKINQQSDIKSAFDKCVNCLLEWLRIGYSESSPLVTDDVTTATSTTKTTTTRKTTKARKTIRIPSSIVYRQKLKHTPAFFATITVLFALCLCTVNAAKFIHSTIHHQHHQQTTSADGPHHNGASDEFSKYTIVRPTIQHSRYKRDMQSTRMDNGLHANQITLNYEIDGKDVILDLDLNVNLTPAGHFLRYQAPNGDKIIKNLTKTEIDLCHYTGTIQNNDMSRVAISTCNGINGIIYDGNETFYIKSTGNGTIVDSDHFLYRHSDMTQTSRCGYNKGEIHNIDFYKNSNFNKTQRFKRSSADTTIIRGPYNANKHSSFVELVLVIDNSLYKNFSGNFKRVHNHCIEIANIINSLYVPLNIFIALIGIVVWNENNEVPITKNGDTTLTSFLNYRRNVLIKDHPNDNAQLLTKEQFDGGVVGKALKGTICTSNYSGGVSMDHSHIVSVVATTIAHEMGHNFGMEHDENHCKCPDDRCIMSASSSSISPTHWSSCSVDQLNMAFHQGMNYCLKNKPTKLFDSPQCGNGFVEPGEQCDCGLPDVCENSCCDPNTCMLYTNASCATGACCDLNTCHPKTAGIQCRESAGECDLPEYCTGESEYCPEDLFKRDTESCQSGKAFCYQGNCRSRDDQCKVLWGPSGTSSDPCYIQNMNGTRHGNCGYDRITNIYMSCAKEDILCGMLQCRHLNERLEFGVESLSVLSHTYIPHGGIIIPCRTAMVDLGLQNVDPGLVPDGAMCGDGRMCVQQKCMAIDQMRDTGMAPACQSANCNGHGICNNKGSCHCDVGFGPPLCDTPGPGGSVHSGPATNPNDGTGFVRIMYVFFLGVVPFVSLVLFGIYYWRHRKPLVLRKSPNVHKSKNPTKGSGGAGGGGGDGGSISPSGGQTVSTPSSTDDMNSSLLKPNETSADPSAINNNMFGHFKGFTLKPLPNARTPHIGAANVAFVHPVSKSIDQAFVASNGGVPNRAAPPLPKPPNLMRKQSQIKPIETTVHQLICEKNNFNETAPALPPLNPGSVARPIISSPILEASTCSAKELLSPLQHNHPDGGFDRIPLRAAPTVPVVKFEPQINEKSNECTRPTVKESAIKRIASFLKKDDTSAKLHSTLPRNLHKIKPAMDKDKLKTIEISAPIASAACNPTDASDTEIECNRTRAQVNRTQSMRDQSSTVIKRAPNIQTFGSMRHPPNKAGGRPGSIVGSRPKSPPPRPPAPASATKATTLPSTTGYQNPPPPKKYFPPTAEPLNDYDECETVEVPLNEIIDTNHRCPPSPSAGDNIYSVIDEYQNPPIKLPNKDYEANESLGLLGEIVNEIENRNFNSIYSVSTLARKKQRVQSESPYIDTTAADATSNEYADTDYMNMKSNSSTTSSGYLKPTTVSTPVARVAPVKLGDALAKPTAVTNNLSSFKRNAVVVPDTDRPPPLPTSISQSSDSKDDEKSIKTNKYLNRSNSSTVTGVDPTTTATITPAKPSSPTTTTTSTKHRGLFNRTKTPPNLVTNSIRGRSPSPAKSTTTPATTTTTTGTSTFGAANRSNKPQPPIKNNDNFAKIANGPQKPKPLAKPTTFNLDNSKIGVVGVGAVVGGDKPKWQTSGNAKITKSGGKIGSDAISKFGTNSTSRTIGKMATPTAPTAAAAATPATTTTTKASVASLQKRFEGK